MRQLLRTRHLLAGHDINMTTYLTNRGMIIGGHDTGALPDPKYQPAKNLRVEKIDTIKNTLGRRAG